MDRMPLEILSQIFSFLGVRDRLRCSVVCKRWLRATNCRRLLDDVCVKIEDATQLKLLSSMSRDFSRFLFRNVDITESCLSFLKSFSFQIRHFSLLDCVIKTNGVLSLVHLEVLVCECDAWCLFDSLPNLTELHLSRCSTFSDTSLLELSKSMPRLKALSLGCTIVYDARSYRRFYPDGTRFDQNPSSLILSFPAVDDFIAHRSRTMDSLNFRNASIPSPSLVKLSKTKHLKLQKIVLAGCSQCSKGLAQLCENQPTLKSLDISFFSLLNDATVESMCTRLPHIEELVMKVTPVTDVGLKHIFQLSQLQKLDLKKSSRVSTQGFVEAARDFKCLKMKKLNLSSCKIENAVTAILVRCRHLSHLNLSFCSITDDHVIFITENLPLLQSLKLKECFEISDRGIAGGPERGGENGPALSNLKRLEKLDLSGCHKITEFGVIRAITFQNLFILYLRDCKNITSSTIMTLTIQNPSIQKIYWQ